AKDRFCKREHIDSGKLLSVEHEKLLKIYAIDVQRLSIVNNSKQYRVVVASKILTEADRLGGIESVPIKFWDDTKESNKFWDFARKHRLIPSGRRPTHQDRQRSADSVTERSAGVLKM